MTSAEDRTGRSVRLDVAKPLAEVVAQIHAIAPYLDDETWHSFASDGCKTSRQLQLSKFAGPTGLITFFSLESRRSAFLLIGFPLIELDVRTQDQRLVAEVAVAVTAVATAASATSVVYDLPSALLGRGDDKLVRLGTNLDEKFIDLLGDSSPKRAYQTTSFATLGLPTNAERSIDTINNGIVLVCGAAGGTQGSTGAHLVRMLSQQGFTVRALVQRDDERAADLRASGISTIVANLLDPDAVERALKGVTRAYFNYPVRSGFLEAAHTFAEAAARIAVERVVSLSHLNAGPDALSPRSREHGKVEMLLDQAGIGAIHLRAGVFFENIRRQICGDVAAVSEIRLPLGDPVTKLPLVAAADVARVAAGLLASPEWTERGPIMAIGEVQTASGVAAILTGVLKRPISYAPLDDANWRSAALAREGPEGVVQIEHLSAVWKTMQLAAKAAPERFRATPETFTSWSGEFPQTFADFAAANVAWFSP